MRFAIPPRAAFALIALASGLLLVLRSRPLERFTGGIQPLLYASGLTEPRSLATLPDGTILALDGPVGAARPVEIDVEGRIVPIAPAVPPGTALVARAGIWAVAPARDGSFLATLPEEGLLVALTPDGERLVSGEVARFHTASGPNPRPTGVAVAPDGTVFVALFATEPGRATSGVVVRVERDGRWTTAYDGLMSPVAIGFGRDGQLYVLELAERYDVRAGRFAPSTGRLMTLGPEAHQRRIIARQIDRPSGLVFTPAGDLYFTEAAYGTGAGEARLLRVPADGLRPAA